jgi:hypothetical protein
MRYVCLLYFPIAVALGCGSQDSKQCSGIEGTYELQFVGGASAIGRLSIKKRRSSASGYDAAIILRDIRNKEGQNEKNTLTLKGVGSCTADFVNIEFGGGSVMVGKDRLRVLGATVNGLLGRKVPDGSFGRWKLTVIDNKDGEHRELRGFWDEYLDRKNSEAKYSSNESPIR